MATQRLTKATVEALKPAAGRYYVWDAGKGCVPGFGVQVLPSGKKVAVFQYRLKGAGRKATARRFTIGAIGSDLPFSQAEEHVEQLRASVKLGGDPVRDTKARALAVVAGERLAKERTFKALADDWLKKKANLRSHIQLKRIVNNHLIDLHNRDVVGLTFADLENVIEGRSPFMARQVVLVLRGILRLGVKRAWITDNLADRIETEASAVPGGRRRVLSDDELVDIWNESAKTAFPFGPIIQLLVLTGQRRSEVANLDWSEIDLKANLWNLPAARSKNGEDHVVHLAPQTVDVLLSLPSVKRGKAPSRGFMFRGYGKAGFNGFSKAKRNFDDECKVSDWRLHDIRRTVATGLREMRISQDVTERILNHKGQSQTGIAAVYDKSKLLPERKAALESWASHVEALIAGRAAKVVPFRAAKR